MVRICDRALVTAMASNRNGAFRHPGSPREEDGLVNYPLGEIQGL